MLSQTDCEAIAKQSNHKAIVKRSLSDCETILDRLHAIAWRFYGNCEAILERSHSDSKAIAT
jgi:hypothetical protein